MKYQKGQRVLYKHGRYEAILTIKIVDEERRIYFFEESQGYGIEDLMTPLNDNNDILKAML